MRRMNPHPEPRIPLVLRRAHWLCVSHFSERSVVVRSRLSDVPAYDHSLCHQQLKRKLTDSESHLANDNNRLIEKQIP
jgi:hypothetical protein